MADVILSEAEKIYILNGIHDNVRNDGRARQDFRILEVETDVVSNTSGSARVRLANSDILVGVKAEIDKTSESKPDEGRLEFFVDCSANATPEFEGRGGDDIAMELSTALTRAYSDPACIDLKSLCLLKGYQCWVLYVDIVVLECGGNLFDAVGFAVKSALFNTRIPKVVLSLEENSKTNLDVSDDPYACDRLDVTQAPCFITAVQIGNHVVLDPSMEEEACSRSIIVMAVTENGSIYFTRKSGGGSIHTERLFEILEVGVETGKALNKQLMIKLQEEEKMEDQKQKKGFLR